MDNTEKARELINKHLYLNGGDGLGITDGDVYRAVLDAVSEALTIPVVVLQSEQFYCANKYWCGVENGRHCYKEECEDWSGKQ